MTIKQKTKLEVVIPKYISDNDRQPDSWYMKLLNRQGEEVIASLEKYLAGRRAKGFKVRVIVGPYYTGRQWRVQLEFNGVHKNMWGRQTWPGVFRWTTS